MKQLKVIISLLLCAILLFLTVGCAAFNAYGTVVVETRTYTIYEKDGHYRLALNQQFWSKHFQESGVCWIEQLPSYSSAQAMFDELMNPKTGVFTYSMWDLLSLYGDKDKTIELFDMENLYRPAGEGAELFDKVTLYGPKYTYSCGDDSTCTIAIWLKNYWEAACPTEENYTRNHENARNCGAHPTRGGTVFQFVSEGGVIYNEDVVYTLTEGNKTVYVREIGLDQQDVPTSVEVFGMQDGGYFVVRLSGLSEVPSPEYLLSFGIERVE